MCSERCQYQIKMHEYETHIDVLIPSHNTLLLHHRILQSFLIHQQILPYNILKRRQSLRLADMNPPMAKPTLHSLLQTLHTIRSRTTSNDSDRRLPALRNVKQIIQQRLPWMRSEEVELIKDKNHALRDDLLGDVLDGPNIRDLLGLAEQAQQAGHGVRIGA